METQKRSQKRSKHSSRRREQSTIGWTPIQISRIVGLAVIAAAPWYFGGAPWLAQYWMNWAALAIAFLLTFELLRRFWKKSETKTLTPPPYVGIALGIAAFGWLQAVPVFSVNSNGKEWAPASVQIQRWFLGFPNSKLDARFHSDGKLPERSEASDTSILFSESKLALSVEPLHSRAAVGGLAMLAVMVWLGSAGFRSPGWQLTLLIFMTILGLTLGILGLANALSWEKINWLGLDGSLSFATFVSKNTAGGFLNLCLAASLGLSAWAFMQPKAKEQRYAYANESPATQVLRSIEDTVAQLTTAQIASLVSTAFIIACVFCTGSRGASISAVVACLIALFLGRRKNHGYGSLVFACIVLTIGLSLIVFFEFDQRLTSGFAKLAIPGSLESDLQAGRTYIWGVSFKSCLFYGLMGSGLGTFHFSHLPFQNPSAPGWYYHAESLYAQALVELGVLGGLAIVATLVMSFQVLRILKKERTKTFLRTTTSIVNYRPVFIAGLTMVVSQAIHSFVDFALIVPAVFLPFGLMLGMLYGAAKQKIIDESEPIQDGASHTKESLRSSRLTKFDDSRFSSLTEVPQRVPAPMLLVWTKQHSLVVLSGFVQIVLLMSSVIPLDAMSRVESMDEWLKEQDGVSNASRGGSPSDYLAGLWGRPWISIGRVPDALRMIGESVLYQFRSERIDELEALAKEKEKISWEITSPLLTRLAINTRESDFLSHSNGTTSFETSSEFLTLMGGEKQVARWDKARELIEKAHLQSPLDWRLVWGRLLLDRRISVQEWNGWFDRSLLLSRHRTETIFQIGVLARQAAKDQKHVDPLWAKAMQMTGSLVTRAATIIALDTPDSDIDVNIFPAFPLELYMIAANPFDKGRFPITNRRLWERIDESAMAMRVDNPNRYIWLARAAAYFDKPEKELEYLEIAVDHNPLNLELRRIWASQLAASGDLKAAIEQAEYCLTVAPDDIQCQAVMQHLKSLESKKSARKKSN